MAVMKPSSGGRWVTIRGARVYVGASGKVEKGPPGLVESTGAKPSARAEQFVNEWTGGVDHLKEFESGYDLHRLRVLHEPELVRELGQHRPSSPIQVYRAAKRGDDAQELQAWTSDKDVANNLVTANKGTRVLKSRLAHPAEILVDANRFDAARGDENLQGEVVLMRGRILQHVLRVRKERLPPKGKK